MRPRADAGDLHIIYLHGGAYCFEITPFHWRLIGEMAERLSARVTVPIYPLAPEHAIHDIIAPGVAVLRARAGGDRPGRPRLHGRLARRQHGRGAGSMAAAAGGIADARPHGADLARPRHDAGEPARCSQVEPHDPWLGIDGGLEAVRLYGGGLERTDWRISPIKGDLAVLPRTLILAGARDILTPDTRRFAAMAAQAGVDVDLLVAEDMFHVWPLIDMPEGRLARDRIVEWLSTPAAPRQSGPLTAALRTAPSP